MTINWKHLARDTAIVWVAQNLGGLVVGFMGGLFVGPNAIADPRVQVALAFSSFVFGIVGFTIVGALVKTSRFKHLFLVAFCVWVLGAPALVFMPITLQQWLVGGALFQVVIVLIGGGLSFLISRPPRIQSSGV